MDGIVNLVEPIENQIEQGNRLNFEIDDQRESKDSMQVFLLNERLKKDEVDVALNKTKQFLGDYSSTGVRDLSIRLVNGNFGEGQLMGKGTENQKIIEVQLPKDGEVVANVKSRLGASLQNMEEEEKNTKCREIINATCASTALHEGVHGLLDSWPGTFDREASKFVQDFERVSGLSNEQGKESTLLDEGITYAVQAYFAPTVEPLGSFAPVIIEGEKAEVVIRKKLGEALRPKVKEYIGSGRTLDDSFFSFATQEIIRLEK